MKELNRLLEIANKLLSPEGCSWDREQTLHTLQPYLLEETHELIEAIDMQEPAKIAEELGDVFYALVFIAKLGEKQGDFSLAEALTGTCEKLIRRHPHVFGDVKVSSNEEIIKNWEEIKKTEKAQEERKGLFDGIPPTLPLLAKAQKMAGKVRKKKLPNPTEKVEPSPQNEEQMGEMLWSLVVLADQLGIDAESALRRTIDKKGAEIGSRHEGGY